MDAHASLRPVSRGSVVTQPGVDEYITEFFAASYRPM
jgi:hypothetical protein